MTRQTWVHNDNGVNYLAGGLDKLTWALIKTNFGGRDEDELIPIWFYTEIGYDNVDMKF